MSITISERSGRSQLCVYHSSLFIALIKYASVLVVMATTFSTALAAEEPSDWPTKPIHLIVPYPPGGGTDIIARIIQKDLSTELGQAVVIENRGGAAGVVGSGAVARAEPDGYTVLFTLSSHTINPAVYKKQTFDVENDFAPVSLVASLPQILVVNPDVQAKNLMELVAIAKDKREKVFYGSVGYGSPGHIAGELLSLRTGTKFQHVPYNGGGPAIQAVLANEIPILWVSIPAAVSYVLAHRLRALAVSTPSRSPMLPGIPTVQEAGVLNFEVDSWYAVFVPRKTPPVVIQHLSKVIAGILAKPEIKKKLLHQGAVAVGSTPSKLGEIVHNELIKWKELAKSTGIGIE